MADNLITYGFMQLEDIADRRVADIEPAIIDTAIYQSAEMYNRDLNAILDTLVETTTQRDSAFEIPTTGELQPLSENGTPIPTQNMLTITQGYPMFRGGDAWGFNREAFAKLTVRDYDKLVLATQMKDARWMFRALLGAIYTNVSWTYKEPGRTDLTVRGLAVSGDGSVYLDQNGNATTADHYTGQAGAISNSANPYTANEAILRAHPSNTGQIVAYIPPDLMADTMDLSGFYPQASNNGLVVFGSGVDLSAPGNSRFLRFGNEVLGVVSETVVVLSRRLPAGRVVSVVDGDKPLLMRQEPETDLQGLRPVPVQVDSNFRKVDWYRKAGFAVRNPISMAVREIGDASYDIPTGYDLRTFKG